MKKVSLDIRDLPKEKLKKAVLTSKKRLLHEHYLTLTPQEAFQLALDMSTFALEIKLTQVRPE